MMLAIWMLLVPHSNHGHLYHAVMITACDILSIETDWAQSILVLVLEGFRSLLARATHQQIPADVRHTAARVPAHSELVTGRRMTPEAVIALELDLQLHQSNSLICRPAIVIRQHTTPPLLAHATLLLVLRCHLVHLRHLAAAPTLPAGQHVVLTCLGPWGINDLCATAVVTGANTSL
jgi:hypothetical protein